MNNEEKIDLMYERFVLREDRFAVQWVNYKGSGYLPVREGRCLHTPPCEKKSKCEYFTLVPLERNDMTKHLRGEHTLGLYQLSEESTVKWICFDVDINKPKEALGESYEKIDVLPDVQEYTLSMAKNIARIKGKGSFLVEHTGNRGYHIWIFFDKPVPAEKAQAVAKWIEMEMDTAERMHVEVFPKQTQIGTAGNLVKIPFGKHKKTGLRCLFVDSSFTYLEDQWEALKGVKLWTESDLNKIIKENNIKRVMPVVKKQSGNKDNSFVCMQRIMEEGLIEGTRDAGIYRLSLFLRHKSFPSDVAEAVAHAVNDKTNPPLDGATVTSKVESAYESSYSGFPCSDTLINPYCSSECIFWKGKVQDHWVRYGKEEQDAIGKLSRD